MNNETSYSNGYPVGFSEQTTRLPDDKRVSILKIDGHLKQNGTTIDCEAVHGNGTRLLAGSVIVQIQGY